MYRERLAWNVKRIVKYHILQYWLNQGRLYAHLHVIQHYFTVTEWGWHLSVSSPNTCTMQCAQNLLSASSKCLLRLGSKSLLSNKTKCFWSGFIPSTIHHLNSEGMTAVLGTTSFGLMLLYMCVCVCVCVCELWFRVHVREGRGRCEKGQGRLWSMKGVKMGYWRGLREVFDCDWCDVTIV